MSKKDEKIQKILEVTADLCIRNGYQGTSVDELTAKTGFSKATIYRYFKSKECLIAATLEHYSKMHTKALIELINDKELSLREKIDVRFEKLRQLVTENQFYGCYFQLAYSEFCNKDEDITSICTQYSHDRVELIVEMLARHDVDDAQQKATKAELIFSGLIATLPISKDTQLIDIAKEMYLKEIF
ncbi:TetR/AcrR family transcriptional regulator [Photobacterium kasasachensis]|uniref:TetR/AcrR family transcriptional regulator n=1 Tax=Photobacterium kasasachensis TaxID=2910240 RepID=UPI003D14D749